MCFRCQLEIWAVYTQNLVFYLTPLLLGISFLDVLLLSSCCSCPILCLLVFQASKTEGDNWGLSSSEKSIKMENSLSPISFSQALTPLQYMPFLVFSCIFRGLFFSIWFIVCSFCLGSMGNAQLLLEAEPVIFLLISIGSVLISLIPGIGNLRLSHLLFGCSVKLEVHQFY